METPAHTPNGADDAANSPQASDSTTGTAPHASRSPLPVFLFSLGLAVALVIGFVATSSQPLMAEDGPVELAQVMLWVCSGVFGLSLCWLIPVDTRGTVPDRAARWFTAWLGVMAFLAVLRELDMHVVANPETLGAWGVRYRLDWWADFEVPIGPKLLWAAVFGVIGFAVIAPIVRAWPTLARALKRRSLVLAMGVVSGLGLFTGWASDDLFREWTREWSGPYLEEGGELVGSWAYLVAVGLLIWRK